MLTASLINFIPALIQFAVVVAGLVGAGNTVVKWAKYFGLM